MLAGGQTMRFYFFRHGIAEDAQEPDFDDAARRLTDKGIERIQDAGRALVRLNIKPTRIYTSPRLRACQTAEILAEALNIPVMVQEELNFGFNPSLIEPLIADLGGEDEVMFVAHEPDLSVTIADLTGGGAVDMKKGGIARVDLISRAPLRGTLIWALTPKVLDVLARG
jgi:phosphohistidine phosphatase